MTFDQILHQYKMVFRKPVTQGGKPVVRMENGKQVPVYHYPNMPRVTRSSLVLIQPLVSGQNSVQFGVLTTDAPVGSTEIRLNLNDEFVISEFGLFMYGAVGSTTGPATLLSNRYWTYSPMQLGNTFIGVQAFYDSGSFNLQIDQVTYLRAWDTMQHEVIPRTQDNPTTVATAAIGQTNATLGNRQSHEEGFVEMTPTITLSGARTNLLTIKWPNGITPVVNYEMLVGASGSATTSTMFFNIDHTAIIFRGFLAQNAAKFQGSQE